MLDHFPYNGARRQVLFYRFEAWCATGPCWYDGAGLMTYPSAWFRLPGVWRLLRFGLGLAGAGVIATHGGPWWRHNLLAEIVASGGLQFPAKVTPYVEFVASVGVIHRTLYNQDSFDLEYSLGALAGAEWFVWGRLSIAAALGWRRSVVDAGGLRIYIDSLLLRVAIGL